MPFEKGGRADKQGNRYEYLWVIRNLLDVIAEKINYVMIEAIGEDEIGADLWIGSKNGKRECQQCKARNGSMEYWDYGSVNNRGIWDKWKFQLDRNSDIEVSLVSPLSFTMLEDLIFRANNTNGNAEDFLRFQIEESSSIFELFKKICSCYQLDFHDEKDLTKAIAYIRRMNYIQVSNPGLKDAILNYISYLFYGEPENIYNVFIGYITAGDIWGQTIDYYVLERMLNEKNITFKLLEKDKRVTTKIQEFNARYEKLYFCFDGGVVERYELKKCIDSIENGGNIILHGKAGIGKSGCTMNIIQYCKNNVIPYLAIKLDHDTPTASLREWSKSLGFPDTITNCINSVSKHKKAIIILDQLDNMRWISNRYMNSLETCREIINATNILNKSREEKISIIAVCRTYDLENDRYIKGLLSEDNKLGINWEKVEIGELNEDEIINALGADKYNSLTGTLKNLVKNPNNLYILQHLKTSERFSTITAAHDLIKEWWDQLCENSILADEMRKIKDNLVNYCEQNLSVYADVAVVDGNTSCINYLQSSGFIIAQGRKIQFVHQTILDYFISESMVKTFQLGIDIDDVIGDIESQSLAKRYQTQMFLQQLDVNDLLKAGRKMLKSQNIRYSIKYLCLEVMSQIKPCDEIFHFILDYCEDEEWGEHILNNLVYRNSYYIHGMINEGIIEKWLLNVERRKCAISIITNLSPEYSDNELKLIEKNIFKEDAEAKQWNWCFDRTPIYLDSEKFFNLRMSFYRKYPKLSDDYIDYGEMVSYFSGRYAQLIAFWYRNNIANRRYESIHEKIERIESLDDYIQIVEIILPILEEQKERTDFYNWKNQQCYNERIERLLIIVLKKANKCFIQKEPERFIEMYKSFFGTGNPLYNEVILDALLYLSTDYSDFVVEYLCRDFNANLFEYTSGNDSKLFYAKKVIKKFSPFCSEANYVNLENKIAQYNDPNIKERFEYRKECLRKYGIYLHFWGDLQLDLLPILPEDRMSDNAKSLLSVLRKRGDVRSIYEISRATIGGISSSISRKELPPIEWNKIIFSDKINERGSRHFVEKSSGSFIENDIETFSRNFSNAVSNNPIEMLMMILGEKRDVPGPYIDALYSGLAYSHISNNIDKDLFETLFEKYPCVKSISRAQSFCKIIEDNAKEDWSTNVLNNLKELTEFHDDEMSTIRFEDESQSDTIESLEHRFLNSVVGWASQSIMSIVTDKQNLFNCFKDTIIKMLHNESIVVRFSCLNILQVTYFIDKIWTCEKMIELLKSDFRLPGLRGFNQYIIRLYPDYREEIIEVVKKCYLSEDRELIEVGAHSIAELYIIEDNFSYIIQNVEKMNDIQANAVVEKLIEYFDDEKYNAKSTSALIPFIYSYHNISSWNKLFYDSLIDLERDRDFVKLLMTSKYSQLLEYNFLKYFDENAIKVVDYAELVFDISRHFFESSPDFYAGRSMTNLIFSLYDETRNADRPKYKAISNQCLDIIDIMYKNQIYNVSELVRKMTEQ